MIGDRGSTSSLERWNDLRVRFYNAELKALTKSLRRFRYGSTCCNHGEVWVEAMRNHDEN